MTYSRFDFVRRGPSFNSQAAMINSTGLTFVQQQLPRCLERQLQRSVMLSLNGLPCCESSVMKAWLNCLESARVSAAAATGSIGSIFDVSMVRGGRQQRPSG